MGLLFGSHEWVVAYMEKLNANKNYEEAAATWEGDFVFVIEPDGNLDHEVRFYVDLWHGKARAGRGLKPGEEQKALFIFSGKWSNYEKLIDGQLDPLKGLTMGKFKLKGDMVKVMRAVKAAQQLVATILMVDTQKY
jgi:putative sterol carrier protein